MGATDQTGVAGEDHRRGSAPWSGGHQSAPIDSGVHSLDSAAPFRSVGFAVSTIGYAVGRRFGEILAPLELEPREFALLRAVSATEGQSQQAIGERLGIPSSRMVAFVDALEGRGLLERRHNPADRRARALYLTEEGQRLLALAFAEAAGYEQSLCGDLSGEERDELLELLNRVALRLGVSREVHSAMGHSALADE